MKTRLALVTVLSGLSLVVSASVGGAKPEPFDERCEYVEAGPPGPKGNRLVVVNAGEPWVNRRGDEIVVHEIYVRCTGRQATVHNIDRIVLWAEFVEVTLGEGRGALGPGATRERSGSEIEVDIYGIGKLRVYGGRQHNSMRIATHADGVFAFNLNRAADGGAPDQDVTVRSDEFRTVRLFGEQGDDLIDARPLTGIGDNVRLTSRVLLFGGAGDDKILGGIEEEELEDGPGDDLIRAGGGDDYVVFGPGHDTVYGGSGDDGLFYESPGLSKGSPDVADRLYGGAGDDLLSDYNGQGDLMRCGRGDDEVERESHDHLGRDCERFRPR